MTNFFALLLPGVATVVLFAFGVGIGRLILRRWRRLFATSLEFHCLAAGAGMGVIAHSVLVLGMAGGWRTGGFASLAVLAAIAAGLGLRRVRRAAPGTGESKNEREKRGPDCEAPRSPVGKPPPTALVGLFALVVLAICMGLRATLPSANYDVLEYHVGAVRHWLREGRIFAFPGLFYASLPFEVEMWYAAGCFAEGNPLLPAAPKLINYGVLLWNLATVYALASALCRSRGLRVLACLIFAVHPLTSIVASDALNDLGVTWFATLAALAWIRWLQRRERALFVLWCVMLGLTVCCKYTAVGLVVFPAVVCLLPVALLSAPRSPPGSTGSTPQPNQATRHVLVQLAVCGTLLGAIVAVVFLPWAVKNLLHHGNPVYPLLSGIFPSATWSPEQTHYYLQAHGRTHPLEAAYWQAFLRNLGRFGPWLVAAMAAGCFVRQERNVALGFAGAIVLGLAVHAFFPGNPARFMIPFLPLAAVLAVRFAEQVHRPERPWCAAVVAPFLLWIGLGLASAIDPGRSGGLADRFRYVGMPVHADGLSAFRLLAHLGSDTPRFSVLAHSLGPKVVESQWFINERTPPDARVFLLYEARIGCFNRTVEVGSVFDRSPLLDRAADAASADELLERLQAEGFDYLYVNEFELRRILQAYGPREPYQRRLAQRNDPRVPPDLPTVAGWIDLYPPFYQDERFARCRPILEQFVEGRRRRAIYTHNPVSPYGLWVAPLRDD